MFYSLEFASMIYFTLAKFSQSAKNMLKATKEMLAKSKSLIFKLKQQSTRTTSTLFWCSTSYKVAPLLVFVVAKILFFSREETYVFWTQPAFTCSKWTLNTIEETVEYDQSCKDARTKPIDAVAVSFGVN